MLCAAALAVGVVALGLKAQREGEAKAWVGVTIFGVMAIVLFASVKRGEER